MAGKRHRLAARRRALGFTQESLAERLGVDPTTVKRWESGVIAGGPLPYARLQLVRYLQVSAEELEELLAEGVREGSARTAPEPAWTADDETEAFELAQRIEASDVGSVTLDAVELGVEDLCRSYTATTPGELLGTVRRYRRGVARLLDGRATLAERRRVMVLGGWVSLLAACVHVDLGQREAANASRLTAHQLGTHAEHSELTAWAFEIAAWQALLDGHYDEAVQLCQAGQRIVGTATSASAYVQLSAQEARAWARRKQPRETLAALDRSAAAFEQLPPPTQPDHHFAFDPRKQVGYTATTLAWLGAEERAEEYARETIRSYEDEGKRGRSLRRLATARIDLALVVATRDRPEEACHLGRQALSSGRLVRSNIWRVTELDDVLRSRYGNTADIQDFHDHYVDVHRNIVRS